MPNVILITAISTISALLGFAMFVFICRDLVEDKSKISILNIFNSNYRIISCLLLISSLVVNFLFHKFGYSYKFFFLCFFSFAMILLAAIDFKTQFLPDIITKPLIFAGAVQGYFGIFTDVQSSVFGAFFGYWILWTVNAIFKAVRGIDGMGGGDFKLLSAIGAWVREKMLPFAILCSSIIGIFISLLIIKLNKLNVNAPTPFGPALVLTGFVAILYGNDIIAWYIRLISLN